MPDLANGNYVSQADADRQWVPAARDVLIETAREYGAWITDDDLSERIQARTGITTRQPTADWIGRVLGKVADDARKRGEPQLASLCLQADLRIGAGYAGVATGTDVRTRERIAAEDRYACYRWHGATMPEDGGEPVVLARVPDRPERARAAPRTRAAPRASTPPRAQMREVTCPSCFMVVPAAPTCRDCGGQLPDATAAAHD